MISVSDCFFKVKKDCYKFITSEGEKFGLIHAGLHAMDILRMEKGYLHWGHDISPEETPFEVGLNIFVSLKKKEGFIGRETMEKQFANGTNKKLVYLTLFKEKSPGNPLILHEEPIYMDGKIVGKTSSDFGRKQMFPELPGSIFPATAVIH